MQPSMSEGKKILRITSIDVKDTRKEFSMCYHDYIIVGAGPAGLQMGYFLGKANRDYLILEGSNSAGSLIPAGSPAYPIYFISVQ